jgi:hypothetical protein
LTTARKMLGDRLLKKGMVVPVAGLSAVAVQAALEVATTQAAAIAAGHIPAIVPALERDRTTTVFPKSAIKRESDACIAV